MSYTFRPAKRENVPLLIGLAGGTGSGKTYSALLLARGLAGGQPFAIVDTENGRAKHYADLFPEMHHTDIHAPFRPQQYADAIQAGSEYPVVVVDSMSHEWAGDGGCLDWHDELMGGDQKKNLSAWIPVKREHKKMVTRLLQMNAHVILCFRAEPKVEQVKDSDGRWKIIPKPSLTGLDGWLPISEKMLPYELTASFLLMADAPGIPKPIKLQEQHKAFFPLDQPISEESGRRLAEWARGGTMNGQVAAPGLTVEQLNAKRQQAGISDDLYRETGASLFPGKAPADLSDADRAALWAELEQTKDSSREEDGDQQGSGEVVDEAEQVSASSDTDGTPAPASAAEWKVPDSVPTDDPDVIAANEAAEVAFTSGKFSGKNLREVADDPKGPDYLSWVLKSWKTEGFRLKVLAFAKVYLPDEYEKATVGAEAVAS